MEQMVAVKVYFNFVADHPIDDHSIGGLLSNVKTALEDWARSSEAGLCPEGMNGYTDVIAVFADQVYKPEV